MLFISGVSGEGRVDSPTFIRQPTLTHRHPPSPPSPGVPPPAPVIYTCPFFKTRWGGVLPLPSAEWVLRYPTIVSSLESKNPKEQQTMTPKSYFSLFNIISAMDIPAEAYIFELSADSMYNAVSPTPTSASTPSTASTLLLTGKNQRWLR